MPKRKKEKSLGQLIREFREHVGLSQEEFGKFVASEGKDPFSQSLISLWEADAKLPTVNTLRRIFSLAKEKHFKLNAKDVFRTDTDIAS